MVIANHNAPEQVVLSGATEAIARVEEALAARRIPAKRLTVATAFHSPLVAGSSAPFLDYLRGVDLAAPEIDVYGSADAMPYPRDPEAVRRRLAAQLAQPVRFVEQIEAMYASGVRTFVEVGAGSVLTELIDRILGARAHRAIHLDRKGRHGLTSLQDALGRLAVAGVPMKFSVLWDDQAPPVEAPAKKPAMSIPVSGVNQEAVSARGRREGAAAAERAASRRAARTAGAARGRRAVGDGRRSRLRRAVDGDVARAASARDPRGVAARLPGGAAPDRRGARGLSARDGRQPHGLPADRGDLVRRIERAARRPAGRDRAVDDLPAAGGGRRRACRRRVTGCRAGFCRAGEHADRRAMRASRTPAPHRRRPRRRRRRSRRSRRGPRASLRRRPSISRRC